MPPNKVPQSFNNDFVLFPQQDRAMMNGASYTMADYPAQYTTYADDEMYNAVPIMSTAGYTESTYSTSGASAQSAASSAVGSPYSQPCHNTGHDQWMDASLLTSSEMYSNGSYAMVPGTTYDEAHSGSYVDPTLVSFDQPAPLPMADSYASILPPPMSFPSHLPGSPSPSELSSHDSHRMVFKSRGASPYTYQPYPTPRPRRTSYTQRSPFPQGSPRPSSLHSEEDGRDSRRCPHHDCGRFVKDIKAHMLTHQAERPQKCPITDCEYHIKGFARKYDRCRHTLTHFKGTMVCNFCPNSGSSLEKSFNRADVFKRHLTSVHGVEQTAPNSRKKTPAARKNTGNEDKVAGCSICSATFRNAQEFYDHLDDCVLKYLDKGEPSEGINELHLKKINNDKAVKETMERNSLPLELSNAQGHHYDDNEDDDSEDADWSASQSRAVKAYSRSQSIGGLTHSQGGIKLAGKGRRGKRNYPASWPAPAADQMPMTKRVLVVYDGDRRLWKDEMMLDNDCEVRLKLECDEKRYVTGRDMDTVKRADALHNATDAERGPMRHGTEVDKLMI